MRARGLYGVILMITEINELIQEDHEARKKIRLQEETWRALVSADGQREVMWGAKMRRGKEGSQERVGVLEWGTAPHAVEKLSNMSPIKWPLD